MAKTTTVARGWSFKQQILTLYYAFKDERTPWYAKVTSLSSLLYLLSPIDFLPDVIPLAGYVDDLFVVPFLVNIATKLLPADVKLLAEHKARARSRKMIWVLVAAAIIIVGILVAVFMLAKGAVGEG